MNQLAFLRNGSRSLYERCQSELWCIRHVNGHRPRSSNERNESSWRPFCHKFTRMPCCLRLITLGVVQHGLPLNQLDSSRALRAKRGMGSRLIVAAAMLLSALSIAAEPGRMVGTIQVFDGPTPFIRFIQTLVSNVAGFKSAQFWIQPKTGSATRPIKVRYARSYLEARGYFDPQTGNVTIPVFGLYAGRLNRVVATLGFSGRFAQNKRFAVSITTPPFD